MWFRFFGYVIIESKRKPRRVPERDLAPGLRLWDVQRLRWWLDDIGDFRRMRPACRQAKVQVSILNGRAALFWPVRGDGSFILAVGFPAVVVIWPLSFGIQVEGNQTLPGGCPRFLAEQAQARRPQERARPEQLEGSAVQPPPAWAAEIQDMAKVVLVEKTVTEESRPGDIIAAKDGGGERHPFYWHALVRQGDTVRRGQSRSAANFLVGIGIMGGLSPGVSFPICRHNQMRGSGTKKKSMPLQQTILRDTGGTPFSEIHWQDKVWTFGGGAEFAYCTETREIRRLPAWRSAVFSAHGDPAGTDAHS